MECGGARAYRPSKKLLAFAIASETLYLAGRIFIRPIFEPPLTTEVALTAWRVLFVLIYARIFLWQFRGRDPDKRRISLHPLLFGAVALALVAGPAAWGGGSVDWMTAVFMVTAPVVAVREELFYRAILQPGLQHFLRPLPAILVAAALFAASHIGAQPMNVITVSALATAGLLFGIVYYHTGSLLLVIVLHTLFDWLAELSVFGGLSSTAILLGNAVACLAAIFAWTLSSQREASKKPL